MTETSTHKPVNLASWSVVIVLAMLVIFAPPVLSSYWQSVLVLFFISAISLIGYRFITLMGGWSFAHVAIMGLGAYAMALLVTGLGPEAFWLSLIIGPIIAGGFALLIAFPVLRTRQYYFFLSTFAAGEALRQCFIQFSPITGGTYGIAFIARPPELLGLNFAQTLPYYYLVLLIFVAVSFGLFRLERSRTGNTIKAVAENEQLAESIGINSWGHRTLAFVLGSAVAGLAGVLMGNFNGIINPLDFRSVAMFKVVAAVIVGGRKSPFGCLAGLLVLTALEELFRSYGEIIPLLWGICVILILLFSRDGLEGIWQRFRESRTAGAAIDHRSVKK